MKKTRYFLKGAITEQRWLAKQAQRGWQLVAIQKNQYHFVAQRQPQLWQAEYVPTATVTAQADLFANLLTYTDEQTAMTAVYTPAPATARLVTADAPQRLKVYRYARDRAINWLNAWVIGVWLLMCAAVVGSAQAPVSLANTTLLLSGLGIGAGIMLLGLVTCGRLVLRYHRQVRILVQRTDDTKHSWQPTFHIQFHHQDLAPDTERLASLGKWLMTMQNQKGDYWFDLRTTLSAHELQAELQKYLKQTDFTVVSFLGVYS
ncbi:hypothetical protein [Lactobacillus sp. CBA3605] [Lactiplantibacillus mudanjiangensis]|uniref:hypothetical protein n=1 Tax=Lactiplantibacillus mudanjiangensis TaxID=1296538 RepID=UPI0010142465|nr:hypothetical protein [Lactobacillus sp. CBA3605] [Lactiplantibacillus mudanjiangensis]